MKNNNKNLTKILRNLNINKLNTIQNNTLEADKTGNDIILLSPTGSGKTLAFLLPILNGLKLGQTETQALILAPSRELALQIEQIFRKMGTPFKISCCYGGHAFKTETNNLKVPPALIIGTPGRVADHLRRKSFDPSRIKTLVLDEFDKALDFGFSKEMNEIIKQLNGLEKRILTSATQLTEVPDFTGLNNPIELNYLEQQKTIKLKQKAVRSDKKDKLEAAFRLLCFLENQSSLLFCNHRESVERISKHLHKKGIVHDIFHGGLEQIEREKALIKFRNGSHHLLITTNLASRGLDIPEIKNIIHYHLPPDKDTFTHRNGRTARMNVEGTSYLILTEDEQPPEYIGENIEFSDIPQNYPLPKKPVWTTIFLGLGKKDKVNKIDIVGLFLQKGKIEKAELGLIQVLDHCSFVAVKTNRSNQLINALKKEKIKRKNIKISVSR